MNQDRFNSMQQAYDNMEAPFDEDLQTQEEIDKENEVEATVDLLYLNASNNDENANIYAHAFISFITRCKTGAASDDNVDLFYTMLQRVAERRNINENQKNELDRLFDAAMYDYARSIV